MLGQDRLVTSPDHLQLNFASSADYEDKTRYDAVLACFSQLFTQALRKKYNVTDEMVAFEPVPIIRVS